MLKRLIAIIVFAAAAHLGATAIDDALSTAKQMNAKITAASEFKTPSSSNIQNAGPDADSLAAFGTTLVSQLQGINVGPVDQIKSASADINVRVNTLKGVNSYNVSAMIEACRGLGDSLGGMQSLLDQLIAALLAEKARAIVAVQTATQWTPPTPVPGPADPGHGRPTATPFPTYAYPTPEATATSIIQPGSAPTVPPTGNPGTLPGGPSLPPPPVVVTPMPPQATPTPRPLLKAPLAVLALGEGDDDAEGEGKDKTRKAHDKVYVANFNMANIAILDADLKRVTGFIPVGQQPVALVRADGHTVLSINYGSNTVSLIDTGSDAVVATLNVGNQPVDAAVRGSKAYVVNQGSNSVTVLDLKFRKVLRSLGVGAQPSRIALRKDRAYVSDTNDDAVSVIDTKIDNVIATVTE